MEEVLKSSKAFNVPSGTENEVQRQSGAPSPLEGRPWSTCRERVGWRRGAVSGGTPAPKKGAESPI